MIELCLNAEHIKDLGEVHKSPYIGSLSLQFAVWCIAQHDP